MFFFFFGGVICLLVGDRDPLKCFPMALYF